MIKWFHNLLRLCYWRIHVIQSFRLDSYNNTPTFTKDYYFNLHPTFARRLINKFNKVYKSNTTNNKIQVQVTPGMAWDAYPFYSNNKPLRAAAL